MKLGDAEKLYVGAIGAERVYFGSELVWPLIPPFARVTVDNALRLTVDGTPRIYIDQASEPVWTPAKLFGDGEEGAWYDPSDLSTLFQDAAGTIPVTQDGDPVGLHLDKSGNGHHRYQTSNNNRPTYRTANGLHWIEYDGNADFLRTDDVDFSGTDELTLLFAIHKLSDSRLGVYCELSADSNANNGSFYFLGPSANNTTSYASLARGDAPISNNQRVTVTGYAAGNTNIITTTHDISESETTMRIDGSLVGTATGAKGDGNFGDYPLFFGRRNGVTLPYHGREYGFVIRSGLLDLTTIQTVEQFLAEQAGKEI